MTGWEMIVSRVPVWVWPLLVLLVVLGLRATHRRETMVLPVYLMPLLGMLSINAVNRFQGGAVLWGVFAVAYLSGIGIGLWFQRRVVLGKSGTRVTLRGEWLTFGLMMTVFWMNFAGGVMRAVAPAIYGGLGFQTGFTIIAGVAAGIFLGRAVRVFRA